MSHIEKTIHARELKHHVEYCRDFTLRKDPVGGFSFPCDKSGNLLKDDINYQTWYPNYLFCVQHPEIYLDNGVVKNEWDYTRPEEVKCSCGQVFFLENVTVCPKCGQWYNGFGQSLKDPVEWGDGKVF